MAGARASRLSAGALLGALLLVSYIGPPAEAAADTGAPVARVATAEGLTEKETKRLLRGDVVIRGSIEKGGGRTAGGGEAYVLVSAGWKRAFELLAPHERAPEYLGCLESVSVLGRGREGEVERAKVRETHASMGIRMRYTIDYVHDPARREIRWALDPAAENDMTENSGIWRFVPVDGARTLLVYSLRGASDAWYPAFVERYFLKTGMKKMLVAVKKRVESGGTWKKDD